MKISKQSVNKPSFSSFLPLLSVLLIDSMGMGIVFPIFAVAFMNPASHFMVHAATHTTRIIEYSVAVSVFMFCWFIGASILGRYSDIKGRKSALIICLSGATLGYMTAFIALALHSFSLLIVSRIIAGLTSGIQPIAWATVADGSAEEKLSRNMGFVVMTICLGYVLGPLLASLFTDSHITHWFMLQTPMLIAAVISALNLVLLYFCFEDLFIPRKKIKLNILESLLTVYHAYKRPQLRYLCMVFTLFVAAWVSYYSYIDVYLVGLFHYSASVSSLFSACLGTGFCIGSGYINAKLSYVTPKNLAIRTILVAAIGCLLVSTTHSQTLIWIISFIIGCVIYIAMPNILTLFSQAMPAEQQGWTMGACGSMFALSFGVTSLITGYMGSIWIVLPIIIAAVGLVLSAIMLSLKQSRVL